MNLPDQFHGITESSIDEKGVYPQHALYVKDGKHVMMALDLDAEQVYLTMLGVMLKEKPDELVFGLDRICKEGQGTTLGDCITGAYWNRQFPLWKPFVIEYQNEPRIAKPIDWANAFWNQRITDELVYFKLEAP